jgi:hypothetical protein
MKLLLCRHLWGVEEDLEKFFPKLKPKGYGAIDASIGNVEDAKLKDLLQKNGLDLVPLLYCGGDSVSEQLKSFEELYRRAVNFKPLRVYCHGGLDRFSEKEQDEFFFGALAIDSSVCFETHRGRILYNPWATARLIEKFPKLRINADLSHWVCVCERLLDGEEEIIKEMAKRCDHVHARVGYANGPQVPDPRIGAWKEELEAHERWWDIIWDSQKSRGLEVSTLTPEFGPPSYQQVNPVSGKPDADLAAICDWQASREAERFKKKFGA